ncbi:MAG TPA: gluconate 2-dehydrogenase subunit 3 family protein [Woeseiaceae bacterium]|nr:gluconate 2-dehydrogenase subunit 3 family protein [Woeseiaceae bacterium]
MPNNRREFLKYSLLAGGAALSGCARPTLPDDSGDRLVGPPGYDVPAGHFFTAAERELVDAAVGRLIPADELGPGALEAGVREFIDRQLSGPYGRAERWYMSGPWHDGSEEQGYQMRYSPAELYRHCIPRVDAWCRDRYGGNFAELRAAQQDETLSALENGAIDLGVFDPRDFFRMLWQNAREGFLADPMYGGNQQFIGWKLIGFPGPRYNYARYITQYGKPYPLPTTGLLGRGGTSV